jgi:hypothetical protein
MALRNALKLAFCLLLLAALPAARLAAQNLTLEGQTGGFLTPTAYVVYTEKGQFFSHPVVSFHFIDVSAVIGNVETFSLTEGFANRAEIGYTRSVHQYGGQPTTTATPLGLSNLWNYSGMNVFHGKVVAFRDGQFGAWMPGIAVGGLVRTSDKFVSGAIPPIATAELTAQLGPVAGPAVATELFGTTAAKSYTNGDVYVAVTKTWAKPPVPFLVNVGWKATNATIYGLGGQSTRFGGRFFGGLGIPLPIGHGIVAVPSAGFTQEPKTSVNLNNLLNLARTLVVTEDPAAAGLFPVMSSHIPTTLDYAVRVTQREHPHFAFDIGVGQVAGNIGSIYVANPAYPTLSPYPIVTTPVNLQARSVVGMGPSYRY